MLRNGKGERSKKKLLYLRFYWKQVHRFMMLVGWFVFILFFSFFFFIIFFLWAPFQWSITWRYLLHGKFLSAKEFIYYKFVELVVALMRLRLRCCSCCLLQFYILLVIWRVLYLLQQQSNKSERREEKQIAYKKKKFVRSSSRSYFHILCDRDHDWIDF